MRIPLFNQGFETEIAEHGHMTSIKDHFQELHYYFIALAEIFACTASAALPVEDHAIRMNLFDIANHFFDHLLALFSFNSIVDFLYCVRRNSIDKHLSSF